LELLHPRINHGPKFPGQLHRRDPRVGGRPIHAMSIPLLTRLYALLQRLYPRRFRAEFADEMLAVFAAAVMEAAAHGSAAVALVCWRELRDWPIALSREHWADLKQEERGKHRRVN
jgi:hypothetical protein